MKKIILQHWTGEPSELELLSFANIEAYAMKVGADYKLLRGNVFRENLESPCQKVFMLDESFDDYDVVVMTDPDMFTATWLDKDLFDETGVGMEHKAVHTRLCRRFPKITSRHHPCWGGAVWRLEKDMRKKLREHISEKELPVFNSYSNACDEGIMHRLSVLAKIPLEGAYITDQWCYGNYFPNPKRAYIWHIRRKYTDRRGQIQKRDKILTYHEFVEKGWITK